MNNFITDYWWLVLGVLLVFSGLFTVTQGTIGVITRFGKYVGIRRPGLRFKIPFIDQVYKRVSIQNRSVELEFQAVTADQANVYFKVCCCIQFRMQMRKLLRKWLLNSLLIKI
jgi:regulator of protease activity HflC (stomatin/prohibitin superfamily)